MSIEQGMKYKEEVWEQLSYSFKDFIDKLVDYRETIFTRQESDMYFLGYFLRAYLDEGIEFEDIIDQIEKGWQDSEDNGNPFTVEDL